MGQSRGRSERTCPRFELLTGLRARIVARSTPTVCQSRLSMNRHLRAPAQGKLFLGGVDSNISKADIDEYCSQW